MLQGEEHLVRKEETFESVKKGHQSASSLSIERLQLTLERQAEANSWRVL